MGLFIGEHNTGEQEGGREDAGGAGAHVGPGQGSTVPRLPMRGGLAPGRCRGASPQDRGEVTASQSGSTSVPRAATALITVLEGLCTEHLLCPFTCTSSIHPVPAL